MKLVALYKKPADPEAFEKRYFEGHAPLMEQVPGLQEMKITRFKKTLAGEGFYMMVEMDFGDKETFNAAMQSQEMAAAGKDVNEFAADILTLMIAK
ncbi:MAG TPA: EthD family reductase [Anaerolineae bacterium]|nr:EthD family reductase [Anaerolineae bacterium]